MDIFSLLAAEKTLKAAPGGCYDAAIQRARCERRDDYGGLHAQAERNWRMYWTGAMGAESKAAFDRATESARMLLAAGLPL